MHMQPGVNDTPLSPENQLAFDAYWEWFVKNGITTKAAPYAVSEGAFYHESGRIGIDEAHANPAFPIGAAMVEEILHYIASSGRKESSADYSQEFLRFIFDLVLPRLQDAKETENRSFQSALVCQLWKSIDRPLPKASSSAKPVP
jgi:hypothetical protein